MKTQIIQLEPHDDVISARDKMVWTQTNRILLVWPARGRILARRLDLLLLQRHCYALGAQLALVTRDGEVRANARSLGIPLFKNERKAQENYWRRPRHSYKPARKKINLLFEEERVSAVEFEDQRETTPARLERPGQTLNPLPLPARFGFFTLGVMALLSIAAVLFPSAHIELIPEVQTQTVAISVKGSDSVDRVNLSGLVPIRELSVIVEGHETLTPTGTAQTPVDAARGEVRFTNLTDQTIDVPPGTIVMTPGASVRFATQREGRVAAGVGESLEVPVIALTPGSAGNLAADRLQLLQGELGASLTATNPQPTSGGRDSPSLAPTALDRSRLKNQIVPTLEQAALQEINAGLAPGDLLISPQPRLLNTIEEIYDPADSQPASVLNLTLVQEYQAMIISGEDLRDLASAVLEANLPDGYVQVPETLQLELLDSPVIGDDGTAELELRAQQQVQARLSPSHAVNLSLGLTPSAASERLYTNLPLELSPQISMNPEWWPRLPVLPFRILVSTEQSP